MKQPHMIPFDEHDFFELPIGTLILNKQNKIVFVTSLSYSFERSLKKRSSRFKGEINGRSADEFGTLPVTVELLEALGWTIDRTRAGRIIATPAHQQLDFDFDPNSLDVHFLLEEDHKEGRDEGDVVARNVAEEFIDVADFHRLDRLFLETFAMRMHIDFRHEVPGFSLAKETSE